jgi:DNA-binding MarR family transcriptional regulator
MSEYRTEKAKLARKCSQSLKELMVGYRALLEDTLRGEGLTLPQLRLLNAIREQGSVSGAMIARTCQVTPQTLQGMLTRAEREGWITRDISAVNRRILTASLTRKGESALATGLASAAEIEEKIWSGVSANTLDQLNLTLEHGIANLRGEITSHRATS